MLHFEDVSLELVVEMPIFDAKPYVSIDGPDDPDRARKIEENIAALGYEQYALVDPTEEFALAASLGDREWQELARTTLPEERPIDPDCVSAFYGGLALVAKDQCLLLPQCCADWSNAYEDYVRLREGEAGWVSGVHPAAWASPESDIVRFDCQRWAKEVTNEGGIASPAAPQFTVGRGSLDRAIDSAGAALDLSYSKLERLLPYEAAIISTLVYGYDAEAVD